MEGFEYEDVYGLVNAEHLTETMREIFETTSIIRGALNDKGYMIDDYLRRILDAASRVSLMYAAEKADDSVAVFNDLISSAMENTGHEHPMYEKALAYIESNPLVYQDETTRHSIYSIALFGDFFAQETDRYRQIFKREIMDVFDNVSLRHLWREISSSCGKEARRLDSLLRRRFFIVTPMAAFAQGLTDSLLLSMTYQDPETGKTAALLCGSRAAV